MTKKASLKPLDKIEIEWIDAYAWGLTHQATISQILADFKPFIRHSIGYFLGEKDDHVLFSTDWDGGDEVGSPQQIPKGMIRNIVNLL